MSTDPELLALLEEERGHIAATSNKIRRIRIPKGESWLLRILPCKLPPQNKSFFARIGQNWLNKSPIYNPRQTSKEYGGSVEAYSPVDDVCEQFRRSPSKEVQDAAYRISANPRWLVYAVVVAKEDDQRQALRVSNEEMYMAHEFALSKTSMSEFLTLYHRGLKKSENSILDLRNGYNIWFENGAVKPGMTLHREDDPSPVFPEDDKFDERVDKALASVQFTPPQMPTEAELDEFAAKAEDFLRSMESRQSRSSRSAPPARPRVAVEPPPPARHAPRSRIVEEELAYAGGKTATTEEDVPYDAETPEEPAEPVQRHNGPASRVVRTAADVEGDDLPEDDHDPVPPTRQPLTTSAPLPATSSSGPPPSLRHTLIRKLNRSPAQ